MKKSSVVSSLTAIAIFSSLASARDLKSGVSGDDVKQWQKFLSTRNFDLPVNGKFGPATQRATVIFQKKWNLFADGIVGPRTLEKAKALGYGGGNLNSQNNAISETRFSEVELHYIVTRLLKKILYKPETLEIVKWDKAIVSTKAKNRWAYAVPVRYMTTNKDGGTLAPYVVFYLGKKGNLVTIVDLDKYMKN